MDRQSGEARELPKPIHSVHDAIETVLAQSAYTRAPQGAPECTLTGEHGRFEVTTVQAEDLETINEMQTFIGEYLDASEVDTVDVVQAGLRGDRAVGSEHDSKYRIFLARDEQGNIASLYSGGVVEFTPHSERPDEAIFFGAYGITSMSARRKGLVRELYASSLMQAEVDAKANGKKLTMVVGESSDESEPAWNAFGRKRVYVQTGPDTYTEIPYVQPPLDFDPDTGLPTEGNIDVPLHLMLQFFDGTADKKRISLAVDAIYRWCNMPPEDEFSTQEALQAQRAYIANLQKQFDDFLFGNGELKLFSANERDEMRKSGASILDAK